MANEQWQKDALDTCFRGLKQNEQLYLAFPTRLAANLLQNKGLLTPTDVSDVVKLPIREQTAKLFDVLKRKASDPNAVAILRSVLSSRTSLSSPLPYLPQLEGDLA